ncbi:hypothetical protein [Halolactibacillus alkaliphilus]|nr:hypothetical protein [Halolactibacillus alkaliphilus]
MGVVHSHDHQKHEEVSNITFVKRLSTYYCDGLTVQAPHVTG